jgi:ribosomal protein L11 methyltransferase
MNWTQIKVACRPSDVDEVCAVMSMIDTKLMIEDSSDVIEFNPVYGELIDKELLERRDEAAVSLFVSEESDAAGYKCKITERFAALDKKYKIELINVNEEDWADNWKQYYKPQKIGHNLVIVPEWENYTPQEGEIIVIMDPGMAFGTGTHESTQLCAELLEHYLPAGARTLDIGTGSGILAITASKLGASEVNAYDIDPMAVRVAGENIIKNGTKNVTCGVSDLLSAVSGLYDFAVANITAEIIMRMAKDVGGYIKPGGMLAVSGVIDEQCEAVKEALVTAGFSVTDTLHANGWSGLLFVKNGKL